MAPPRSAPCRIELPSGEAIDGDLTVPEVASGLVVFAHGSGSSRLSPRNQAVASYLNGRGLATLLMDLLTAEEDERDRLTREHRFDIGLLGRRVVHTIDWLAQRPDAASLPLGTFGASTGAAAALIAAAERPERVRAVVSRGGRPDLAGDALPRTTAPTLLLVGGRDTEVLQLNREAASHLGGPWQVVVVPGATHLFEEPGALDEVQDRAASWFLQQLSGTG